MAEEVYITGTRQMFYARPPAVKGTAGGVAFLIDEVMPASRAYHWTVNHIWPSRNFALPVLATASPQPECNLHRGYIELIRLKAACHLGATIIGRSALAGCAFAAG